VVPVALGRGVLEELAPVSVVRVPAALVVRVPVVAREGPVRAVPAAASVVRAPAVALAVPVGRVGVRTRSDERRAGKDVVVVTRKS
jgi:hypothetical protein